MYKYKSPKLQIRHISNLPTSDIRPGRCSNRPPARSGYRKRKSYRLQLYEVRRPTSFCPWVEPCSSVTFCPNGVTLLSNRTLDPTFLPLRSVYENDAPPAPTKAPCAPLHLNPFFSLSLSFAPSHSSSVKQRQLLFLSMA